MVSEAKVLIKGGLADSTNKVYASARTSITKFLTEARLPVLLPFNEQVLVLYLTSLLGKVQHSTVKLYMNGIKAWHTDEGHKLELEQMPMLKKAMQGFLNLSISRPKRQPRLPITTAVLNQL